MTIEGPQLKPLAEILLKFDRRGFVPQINKINEEIVVTFPHRFYCERYIISRSGNVGRFDIEI